MDKNRVGYLTAEEKEKEDQEQIEYLRQWKEKREKKREHRRKVKLYDRLFVGVVKDEMDHKAEHLMIETESRDSMEKRGKYWKYIERTGMPNKREDAQHREWM